MTTSRYLLPDTVLGRGPRISKAIRSKGAPNCSDAASLGYVSLAPSELNNQGLAPLFHVSSHFTPEESLSNSVQSFHDAEMTSCWAAMQFFEYLLRDRGSTNCHLNVFPSSDSNFRLEHHS
ncbi:hypothetical protein TNCV_1189391 [Trichonephila clavipes]|nr:hypothetical protein TNCV_1189391 [Trichonephila clavipes]